MASGYKEFLEATESVGGEPSDVPSMGNMENGVTIPTDTSKVRYFTGNISNDGERVLLEDIMTRSVAAQAQLNNPGDLVVISEQGTFDKDGCYHVAVKYIELLEVVK